MSNALVLTHSGSIVPKCSNTSSSTSAASSRFLAHSPGRDVLPDGSRRYRKRRPILLLSYHPADLRSYREFEVRLAHPVVADAARALLEQDPRTRSGIVATAQSHLALYHEPLVAAATETSDFTPSDLVDPYGPPHLPLLDRRSR